MATPPNFFNVSQPVTLSGRDGRVLKLPMPRQIYLVSKMTETDLNAIVAWVLILPPIE